MTDALTLDESITDDLITAGYRFNNQSNDSSCGCGASFGVAGFPELDKGVMSCGT